MNKVWIESQRIVKTMNGYEWIDKLFELHELSREEWKALLLENTEDMRAYAAERARVLREAVYGKDVYIRGLIEFTNYCKNDCLYCGIRRGNGKADRYRLTDEEILSCCEEGYRLGFRTFVLQGGEDGYFTDERLVPLVSAIREKYPDCAITLSVGERSKDSYKRLFEAGADRYLLRHETASEEHYQKLHPQNMSLSHRKQCLWDLKDIGYQVGSGFMVGSPYQTVDCLVEDLLFLKELNPAMVGIGPYVVHKDTPFAKEKNGSVEMTLYLISLLRLMLPHALLPATTSLGTLDPGGREKGILAGANVVMPNLSPVAVRDKYKLYDNKICTGDEAAQCIACMKNRVSGTGYQIVVDRGDCKWD